jgi:DNA modification methylase
VIHTGDCVTVMAGMEPESVDAIVTDPPYGLEFMGKEWDRLDWRDGGGFSKPGIGDRPTAWTSFGGETANPTCATCGGRARGARKCSCEAPDWRVKGETMTDRTASRSRLMQEWHQAWATAALRVAKPGAYLLAFGGTRTVHRLTVALEDAGWIIRDLLVWAYAQGFPKSKSSLKPAWEPIVLARKPGPLRELAIDAARLPTNGEAFRAPQSDPGKRGGVVGTDLGISGADIEDFQRAQRESIERTASLGRWPANVILTDPIFDGGWEGVVGGGWQESTSAVGAWAPRGAFPIDNPNPVVYGDSGTYSRFFLISKASRSDREPLTPGGLELGDGNKWNAGGIGERRRQAGQSQRFNVHPTVKPVELMRHLVRLVTPQGGTVLDPFLGSGTTAIAAEQEGFDWIGIEREAEYVAIARQRLVDQQRGLGLDVPAAAPRMPKTRPDYESHIPKRRSPSENWSGAWAGQEPVDEDIA